MADNNKKIEEFVGVTGVDVNRATFYLQSANWELHIALETFYDNDAADPSTMVESDMPEEPFQVEQPKSGTSNSRREGGTTAAASRFGSIAHFQGDENSSDEEGQAFYAGGSEQSGQQILGPDRKKKNPTQALFDAAKQHGAEVVSEDHAQAKKPNKPFLFRGAGFKLGSDVQPSEQVSESMKPGDIPTGPTNVKIKFWKNGFSIDSGPLREFNDPANKDTLDAIKRGEVPPELRSLAQNGEVHVDMEDRREEEYTKTKVTVKAFGGAGQKLGSPSPTVSQNVSVPAVASHVPSLPAFKIDDSKPATTIQIRLSDGTRLVSKFNHNNTVGDIRNLVRNARSGTGNFNLMTTFPNKVLSDDSITISDAKLLNAVIVQRLT